MPTVDEQLIASLGMQNGVTTSDAPDTAVMEGQENQEQPTEAPQSQEQNAEDTGMVNGNEPQSTEQPSNTPAQVDPPDYDSYIAEQTGGLFKNTEELKASLDKVKQYDTLKQERDAFEAKTKESPYANDTVKKLDELYRKGATQDQIENFQKINKVADINALSPLDAKLAKMVLVDGWREDVAKLSLEQEFPIDDYEEGSPERKIMEEKLRISAEADKKALEGFKADVSEVKQNNTQEELRLQAVAKQEQHNEYVKATVPAIASQINGMGEIAFKPREGDAVKMKFDYPQEFKAQMSDKLFDYFSDGQTPINDGTIAQAFKAINASYLDDNFPAIAQKIFDQGYNLAEERATNKYENRSGLPQSSQVHNPNVSNETAYGDFLKGLVKN